MTKAAESSERGRRWRLGRFGRREDRRWFVTSEIVTSRTFTHAGAHRRLLEMKWK